MRMKLPILLAAGFREISGIILGPHHQLTRRLAGERCEVDRERRVSTLVVAGCTNKEIANQFTVSEETIKHHLTRIFDKVGASNRLELAVKATSSGLAAEL